MTPGAVRVPKLGLRLGGKHVAGCVSVEVQSNSHYQADTWRAELALNAPGGRTLATWGADDLVGQLFTVLMGLDGDVRPMIVGEADKIEIQPERGTVSASGRDLTARLIDHRIQEAFQNKTASEVATILAQRRGLTPKVTATTTPVSRYYQTDHDQVSHDQNSKSGTEWDLLTKLAQFEGFDCYVSGTELHFEKAVDPAKAEPWGVHWDGSAKRSQVVNLRLDRSLTLAKDVLVEVRSWSSARGRGFTKRSPKGKGGGGTGGGKNGPAQRFTFRYPNLTEDQAQKKADQLRADISKHERTLSFDCPGNLDLTARDVLAVSGVGGWDQRYFVASVTRRVSMDGGFPMTVSAKNHSPESEAPTT